MKGVSSRKEVRIMKWDSSDESNWGVVAVSGWRPLEDYQDLKAKAGVYIFADVDLQVKYVGKAGAARMVDEIADAKRRSKASGGVQVKALYINSDEKAQSLEADLIDKYDPPNNRT